MIDIIKAFIEGFMKTFTETFLSNPIYIGFVIFGILCAIFYSKIIGFMGEFWVKTELWKLSKKDYIILNNIMIYSNNTTHQIDHIVISKYGIFVIETKNYSGLIIGDDMKYEDGHIVTDYHKRASIDQSLKGINKIAKEQGEEVAQKISDNIIKNTYRTLMTRVM